MLRRDNNKNKMSAVEGEQNCAKTLFFFLGNSTIIQFRMCKLYYLKFGCRCASHIAEMLRPMNVRFFNFSLMALLWWAKGRGLLVRGRLRCTNKRAQAAGQTRARDEGVFFFFFFFAARHAPTLHVFDGGPK